MNNWRWKCCSLALLIMEDKKMENISKNQFKLLRTMKNRSIAKICTLLSTVAPMAPSVFGAAPWDAPYDVGAALWHLDEAGPDGTWPNAVTFCQRSSCSWHLLIF